MHARGPAGAPAQQGITLYYVELGERYVCYVAECTCDSRSVSVLQQQQAQFASLETTAKLQCLPD